MVEHVVFRGANFLNYNPDDYDKPQNLPLEATQRRDEIYNQLQDRLALPVPERTVITGEPGAPIFGSPAPSIIESAVSSEPPSARRPAPGGVPAEVVMPQLSEILEMLRQQRDEYAEAKQAEVATTAR